jgi:hypothetical protein
VAKQASLAWKLHAGEGSFTVNRDGEAGKGKMFFCLRKKAGKRQRTESKNQALGLGVNRKIDDASTLAKSRMRESVPPLKSGVPIAGTQRQVLGLVVLPFCQRKGGEDRFSK